ncbi:TadE/TadG family type IV pilus assembly protein [Aggregatilinea lenta]|uniref:TadE/TadG family type IV pilus assembly protein n=1 Tax=Aggregatilinea lenta TaxID=913108 RepID=UPI000E5B6520|nr:TadE family protein [Aggregatilinea lenta]
MYPTEEHKDTPARSRRGQTMAEFALTLPILLMLMFGVIEFARIFHAWITLQNSARTAARYAVTGQWDEDSVAAAIGYVEDGKTGEERRQLILDTLIPCTTDPDALFTAHWGRDCDPAQQEDQGLRADLARLPSIIERARYGAQGLGISDGDHIVGLTNPYTSADINTETVDDSSKGWFHVWMCSERRQLDDDEQQRYKPSADRTDRICEVVNGEPNSANQYDAGGPGDAVEIIVFFNHPLITPLGLVDYVPLQARRVMINESFRSTRVVNLPGNLVGPTWTASHTATGTSTNTLTYTPTITLTPSFTPSITDTPASPTASPLCEDLGFRLTDPVQLVGNTLQVAVTNSGPAPFFLSGATVQWKRISIYPDMYASAMQFVGRAALWSGHDSGGSDPQYGTIDMTDNPPYPYQAWLSGPPNYDERRVETGDTIWQMRFSNGPSDLNSRLRTGDFGGTVLYFSTEWGGATHDCTLPLTDLPLPTSTPETPQPTPACSDYALTLNNFLSGGVVQYRVQNTGAGVGRLTGFSVNWDTYNRPFFDDKSYLLDRISVGGTSATDSSGIVMWNGTNGASDRTPPVVASTTSGTGWNTAVALSPGAVVNVWLVFTNLGSGNTDFDNLGVFRSDFNATTFTFDEDPNCSRQVLINTPTVTYTPTNTAIPTATQVPVDLCPNIDGIQATIPPGMVIDSNGNCVTDACPNIIGIQQSVPSGYWVDSNGNCQPDVCPNISGIQQSIPSGMVIDSGGNCVTDACPNISGIQQSVPSGYWVDSNGNCQPDVCPNISGIQQSIPSGMSKDSNGNCVPDACPNISGIQSSVPSGYWVDSNGNCQPDVCPNISGVQQSIPSGMVKDSNGNCVSPTPVLTNTPTNTAVPTDVPPPTPVPTETATRAYTPEHHEG